METINLVIEMIKSLGFPIFAFVAVLWMYYDTVNKHREEISKLNEEHGDEVDAFIDALNNNTVILQKLCDKLEEWQTHEIKRN